MPMRVTRGGWQRATPVQSPAGQQPWWSPASEILRFQTILDDYIVGGKIADLIFDFGDDMYGRRGPYGFARWSFGGRGCVPYIFREPTLYDSEYWPTLIQIK